MNREVFGHHTSRAIAAYRLGLAMLFGAWVWADPTQPARGGHAGYILFAAYLLFAMALLPLSWRSWWYDFRLGMPVLVIDGLAFILGIFYTETPNANFFTPFLTFLAFILISTRLRWGRRAAVLTAVCIGVGYLLAGQIFSNMGFQGDALLFLRRFSYMVVLSLLFTTFALHRPAPDIPRFVMEPFDSGLSPQEQALAYAIDVTRASGALLGWAAEDEPRMQLFRAGSLGEGGNLAGPDGWDLSGAAMPFIFDVARRRVLALQEADGLRALPSTDPPGLVTISGAVEGLSIPLQGVTGRGQIVLTGVPGMSQDDIGRADAIGKEIAKAIDDEELDYVAREIAVARSRATLARDLHDSVAQSLAGANFRLQALRSKLEPGSSEASAVETIMSGMQDEQQHVRSIIEGLRRSELEPGTRNLVPELVSLLETLARRWGVETRFDPGEPRMIVPAWLNFEIQQIVREGVANAARHAAARWVRVQVVRNEAQLFLTVANDCGQEVQAEFQPRSLTERANALGGSLKAVTTALETRIEITLPIRGKT